MTAEGQVFFREPSKFAKGLPLNFHPPKIMKKNINGADYLKEKKKLSLKGRGDLVIFEHFDHKPLYLLQFGMASKLTRTILCLGDEKPFLNEPHLGQYG